MENVTRWKEKVALVTGASSGIGRATALALARIGMKVAITGRREERLRDVQSSIEDMGSEALSIAGDQTIAETNHMFFAEVRKKWGGVDVLVNNAGTPGGTSVTNAGFETIQSCFDLNVLAASVCMREAVADMRRRGAGVIVNVTSMRAHRFLAGGSVAYSASKHALRLMSDGLRTELAAEKSPIKIAMVSPGRVKTEMLAGWEGDYKILEPEDIADAVLYILSAPSHVQICDMLIRPVGQVD